VPGGTVSVTGPSGVSTRTSAPSTGLPRPERQVHLQIVVDHAVARVRQQPDAQVHVARRAAVDAGPALARQT